MSCDVNVKKTFKRIFYLCIPRLHMCVSEHPDPSIYIFISWAPFYIYVYPDHLYIFVYITVLSYKQNNFGCFLKELEFCFFKTPKIGLLIFQKPNIAQRLFVFKTNGRISSITSYKDHRCSLFMSWVIKQQRKLYFENVEKTPNFRRVVHTQIRVHLFISC